MLSARTTHQIPITQPSKLHVRTEIVILSPIPDEKAFRYDLETRMSLVRKVLAEVNLNIEDVIRAEFGADIESVTSTIQNR